MLRCEGRCTRVRDHETARAVGALGHAGLEPGLANQCSLLVTGYAAHRNLAPEAGIRRDTEVGCTVPHFG